jgi:uncharacterized protein YkwD
MTERRHVPAASELSHRAPARRRLARHRRRRAPGLRTAAVLALVVGVGTAALLTSHEGQRPTLIGDPASISAAAAAGDQVLAATDDRGSRGEPRSVPGRTAAATPTGAPVPAMPPAKGLSPAPRSATPTTASAAAPAGSPPRAAPASSGGPVARPAGSSGTPDLAQLTGQVVTLTNAQRTQHGCGALRTDAKLTAAAQQHSEDMAARDYFDHNTPEGRTPWDRIEAQGYPQPSAENIAMGYPTAQAVVEGWMNSPGHAANILNCDSHAIGVGYDPAGNYWTQDFGYA